MNDNKIHLPSIGKGKFWNLGPMVVTGCTHVSPGCENCWSEKLHAMRMGNPRMVNVYSPDLMTRDGKFNGEVQFNLRLLENAVKTRKPQVIALWNDLYHEGILFHDMAKVFDLINYSPQHTFLIITKRPERAAEFFELEEDTLGLEIKLPPHVWHIVTMENQAMVDERMPHLLNIPGQRGIIIEPMLGPVDLEIPYGQGVGDLLIENIHQVILGGETGPGARPMHPDWVRSVRDQCQATGVPFFFKSCGRYITEVSGATDCMIEPGWMREDGFVRSGLVPYSSEASEVEKHQWIKCGKVTKGDSGRTLDGREHNDLAWVTS